MGINNLNDLLNNINDNLNNKNSNIIKILNGTKNDKKLKKIENDINDILNYIKNNDNDKDDFDEDKSND